MAPESPLLGVMVLAHARPQLLRAIVRQAREIDPSAVVQITSDRPTDAVVEELATLEAEHFRAAVPALDRRENFLTLRNQQLNQMRGRRVKYGVLWDDDHLLQDTGEARRLLVSDPDLVYATKAYLWNSLTTENVALPVHRSAFFFRMLPGDQFPLTRMINAPEQIHDNAKVVTDLTGRLFDVGYLTEAERRRVWEAYKRAGKLDRLTMGLVSPGILRAVPAHPILDHLRQLL